jgi:hypothetical protein
MSYNAIDTIIIFLAICLFSMMTGCSSGGSGSHIAADQKNGSVAMKLGWSTTTKTAAKATASVPADVAIVRIIISASDIPTALQKDFPAAQGTGTLDGVPVGSERTVVAQGLDTSGTVTYQGSTINIVVQAGKTTDAGTITMSPVATTAFNGTIVLGSPTASSIKPTYFLQT